MARVQIYRFTKGDHQTFITAELKEKFLGDGFKEDHTWCDPYFVNQSAKGGKNENESKISGDGRDEKKNASESGQSDGNGEVAKKNQGAKKTDARKRKPVKSNKSRAEVENMDWHDFKEYCDSCGMYVFRGSREELMANLIFDE